MNCVLACLGSVCLILMSSGERGGTADKHAAAMLKCAEECSNCQRACDSCSTHCAHMIAQGKKEHLATLQTCQDCATHCQAAAAIMARRGPFSDTICKACLEACARCAKECEKHPGDTHMKQCAQACRKCEQACRDMLTHLGSPRTTSSLNICPEVQHATR